MEDRHDRDDQGGFEVKALRRRKQVRFRVLIVFLIAGSAALSGCALFQKSEPVDLRAALLASARRDVSDFPDDASLTLTHFSHVGNLLAADGRVIHVVDQRAVVSGMPAPRGLNRILFFDSDRRFLGSVGYVKSRPLWCEGGYLFLFGELDGFFVPDALAGQRGNVIDVSAGFDQMKCYHLRRYGSSGGVE